MARIKFYNKKTGTWEYADIAQGSSSGLPLPNTAKVGQFIMVSAVENGVVTATEAVDPPIASGSKRFGGYILGDLIFSDITIQEGEIENA